MGDQEEYFKIVSNPRYLLIASREMVDNFHLLCEDRALGPKISRDKVFRKRAKDERFKAIQKSGDKMVTAKEGCLENNIAKADHGLESEFNGPNEHSDKPSHRLRAPWEKSGFNRFSKHYD